MTLKLGGTVVDCYIEVDLIRAMFAEYENVMKTAGKYKLEAIAVELGVPVSIVCAAINQGAYSRERWYSEALRLNKIRVNLRKRAKEVGPAYIAKKFNISESHVYSIVRKAKWKNNRGNHA